MARLLEITGDDASFVDELIDTFIDDAATQIEIALQKAGIRPDEDFSIERFRVDRFH